MLNARMYLQPPHSLVVNVFIVTRNNMEIWTVKLQFLLIYENMLKSIAVARSECTAKQEIFIIVKNIILAKYWFVVSNF